MAIWLCDIDYCFGWALDICVGRRMCRRFSSDSVCMWCASHKSHDSVLWDSCAETLVLRLNTIPLLFYTTLCSVDSCLWLSYVFSLWPVFAVFCQKIVLNFQSVYMLSSVMSLLRDSHLLYKGCINWLNPFTIRFSHCFSPQVNWFSVILFTKN